MLVNSRDNLKTVRIRPRSIRKIRQEINNFESVPSFFVIALGYWVGRPLCKGLFCKNKGPWESTIMLSLLNVSLAWPWLVEHSSTAYIKCNLSLIFLLLLTKFHSRLLICFVSEQKPNTSEFNYRTRAIITRGLYTFYPLFEVQKRFFKELFS